MYNQLLLNKLNKLETPFYLYNIDLLNKTLDTLVENINNKNFKVHFAVKANANNRILESIKEKGLGADCVSGNEIAKVLSVGFHASKIVFAGVGKSNKEILTGIDSNVFCFNCESLQELNVINELAGKKNKIVNVALRLNPNIDANTHHYITTGLSENKFGISKIELNEILNNMANFKNLNISGIHFHIGSQITNLEVFKSLCTHINELQKWFIDRNISFKHINVGGGLGIDYVKADEKSIPDFKSYFNVFNKFLEIRAGQTVHFELGRAIAANCGSLISKVLFIKKGDSKKFVVLDAGMTELIRPALYQAYHKIINITSDGKNEKYDVVGPICESTDVFGKNVSLNKTNRGDLLEILSTGAYGEVMSSNYNLRERVKHYYSDELLILNQYG